MAQLEIPVQVYMDNLEEIIDELKQLQTYKLYEGAEQLLVSCDEVVKVFEKHLRTEVGKPEIVRCKKCKWSYDDVSGRICSYGVCVDCVVSDDFYCADAERRTNE